LIKTFNATTDENGLYSYVCGIPSDRDPGKYAVTASYETPGASTDAFVKLVAPQEHGLYSSKRKKEPRLKAKFFTLNQKPDTLSRRAGNGVLRVASRASMKI